MERYNPFAADSASSLADEPDPFSSNPLRRQLSASSSISSPKQKKKEVTIDEQRQASLSSRYSTSFPDPFGEEPSAELPPPPPPLKLSSMDMPPLSSRPPGRQATFGTANSSARLPAASGSAQGNRSNSVTFLHRIVDDDDDDDDSDAGLPAAFSSTPTHQRYPSQRDSARGQAASFGAFLSRATSVTSSSVSDRVTGAVGSVRNAVDSLSTQLQSAVPSNLGLTASNLMGPNLSSSQTSSSSSPAVGQQAVSLDNFQRQQQSATSYLASKLSSATNQFVGVSNQVGSSGSLPTICRQRVVLMLDGVPGADWAAHFQHYRRLVSGLAPNSSSSGASAMAFSSFFASQFSSPTSQDGGADLIEQVDFADASVLANQASSTCSVYVSGLSAALSAASTSSTTNRLSMLAGGSSSPALANTAANSRIIRPEYVVVRQRAREKVEHLRSVVKALHYCLVPMFEPYEVWNIFQDRQLIFSKLLRVQKQLGKEQFPLIGQIYCQTHQDLFNYIQNSSITLPCLVRTGPLGKGKIKIESLQMLRDFGTIMATSQQSCTIEQFLDVKCDLIVQKLGTSLKLFKGNAGSAKVAGSASREQLQQQSSADGTSRSAFGTGRSATMQQQEASSSPNPITRQAAARQTSLGSGMLSSLSSGLQQVTSSVGVAAGRRISNPLSSPCAFEKLPEVMARYREWMEAIAREFDHKMDAFSLKIVVAADDREYIVGLRNCSMEFLGSQENQEEDRRSFVELIISKMNVALPKQQPVSREPSSSSMATAQAETQQQSQLFDQAAGQYLRRTSSDDQAKSQHQQQQLVAQKSTGSLADRKNIMSQTDVGGGARYGEFATAGQQRVAPSSQLNNRSRSVSMNQSDPMSSPLRSSRQTGAPEGPQSGLNKSAFYARRSSDRTDSQATIEDESMGLDGAQGPSAGGAGNLFGQRQFSLGQSIFEQTSSAFGSLQKQSMSFLKRLDSRTGADLIGAGTPPMSAKSDTGFDRNFSMESRLRGAEPSAVSHAAHQEGSANGAARAAIKSQSVDSASSSFEGLKQTNKGRQAPPKPPPPPLQSIMNRQSSLANYSTQNRTENVSYGSGPSSTPTRTALQNSPASSSSMNSVVSSPFASGNGSQQRSQQRVKRQNSALSAFEPFDPDLRADLSGSNQQVDMAADRLPASGNESSHQHRESGGASGSPKKPSGQYDTASMTSGNSDETTTAEDTMNNLKKTFASIFGDKCE